MMGTPVNTYLPPRHLPRADRPAVELVEALTNIEIWSYDGTKVDITFPKGTRGLRHNRTCSRIYDDAKSEQGAIDFVTPKGFTERYSLSLETIRVVPPEEYSVMEKILMDGYRFGCFGGIAYFSARNTLLALFDEREADIKAGYPVYEDPSLFLERFARQKEKQAA
ncbi:MAG: hypothetical protein COY40_00165 [Alphaproteobacteria bacterium CG_4_10_14_0_8_um_filter_53_9]|nr:MAG: hypothetical protein COY40_00165 [Alphaproteobacteria bacterium CG_4_10_14_0_8_um_filter_53_9]